MKISIGRFSIAIVLAMVSTFSAPLMGQTVLYRTTPYNLPPNSSCAGGSTVITVAQGGMRSTLPYDGRLVLGAQETRVLRQRVSVPLDRLVQPTTLAEWVQGREGIVAPAVTPIVKSVERSGAQAADQGINPFVDDVQSVAKAAAPASAPVTEAVDPFAIDNEAGRKSGADDGGTIPAKKLMGILGKVVTKAAPVPSLEKLKQAVPSMPGAGGSAPPRSMPLPPQGGPVDAGGPADAGSPGGNEDPFAR